MCSLVNDTRGPTRRSGSAKQIARAQGPARPKWQGGSPYALCSKPLHLAEPNIRNGVRVEASRPSNALDYGVNGNRRTGFGGKVMTSNWESRPLAITACGKTIKCVYSAEGSRLDRIE